MRNWPRWGSLWLVLAASDAVVADEPLPGDELLEFLGYWDGAESYFLDEAGDPESQRSAVEIKPPQPEVKNEDDD